MLAERIDAVARDMPLDIRRWFLEHDYAKPSVQDQDWDLILADWDRVPLLVDYCQDPANLLEKRFDAFSALMVLLYDSHDNECDADRREGLKQKVVRIVLADRDFAHRVSDEWLGGIEGLMVRRMLGEAMPRGVPEWMSEEAERRA